MAPPRPKVQRGLPGDLTGLLKQVAVKVGNSSAQINDIMRTQEQILKTQVTLGTTLAELLKTNADRDAVAASLTTIASKIDAMDGRHTDAIEGLRSGQAGLAHGQSVLVENQLEINRKLDAILAHLGAGQQRGE